MSALSNRVEPGFGAWCNTVRGRELKVKFAICCRDAACHSSVMQSEIHSDYRVFFCPGTIWIHFATIHIFSCSYYFLKCIFLPLMPFVYCFRPGTPPSAACSHCLATFSLMSPGNKENIFFLSSLLFFVWVAVVYLTLLALAICFPLYVTISEGHWRFTQQHHLFTAAHLCSFVNHKWVSFLHLCTVKVCNHHHLNLRIFLCWKVSSHHSWIQCNCSSVETDWCWRRDWSLFKSQRCRPSSLQWVNASGPMPVALTHLLSLTVSFLGDLFCFRMLLQILPR